MNGRVCPHLSYFRLEDTALRRRKRAVMVVALAIAGGAGLPIPSAEAQNLRPVLRDDDGLLPPIRPRATQRPRAAPALPAEDTQTPQLRPALPENEVRDDGSPGDQDPDLVPAPSGVRPAVRDGDGEPALEPEAITDGGVTAPEDYRNPDGQDPVLWDSRSPEDLQAFERPPAGYDAEAFGVELAPIEDRRPERLFRFEPWQPRGIRLGSFTVFPQADIGAAWVSNLFRSKPARADQALELRPTIRAVSNWRTHAVELRATAGLSFFDDNPSEDDRAYTIDARGRLDVTRRTQISGGLLRDVVQEARGTLESRLRGGARADVETNEARLQVDHRFNRLAVQLRGLTRERTYEDVAQADGSLLSNRDRNGRVTEETARLAWSFKPTLSAFAEAGLNQRRFEAASPIDGIKRDSDGERYRVGLGFGSTSQVLRGEASIGYGRQAPLDRRLVAVDGMTIDANLAWRVSGLTAVLLRASSDIVETSSLSSSGGLTRRGQVEVRHAFMRPLIGSAFAGISTTSYQGIVINENLTELGVALEYYLSPEAVLFGRYQHAALRTNAQSGDWDADEVRVGLRIRR